MEMKKRKLLIVDDNIDFINFILKALDGEDYKLSIALDGNTAI